MGRVGNLFKADTEVFGDRNGDIVAAREGAEVFRIYPDGRLSISDLEAFIGWLSGADWGIERIDSVAAALHALAEELGRKEDRQ